MLVCHSLLYNTASQKQTERKSDEALKREKGRDIKAHTMMKIEIENDNTSRMDRIDMRRRVVQKSDGKLHTNCNIIEDTKSARRSVTNNAIRAGMMTRRTNQTKGWRKGMCEHMSDR